jgi:1-acyl-sn-glycerol-3-phosphate acyltransferase
LLFLRSVLFHFLFYASNALQMIFWTPVFFLMPRREAWKVCKLWAISHLWLQYFVCGTRAEFRGLDRIRPNANQLIASKHQSVWETYTMILFFKDASYVLKRELTYIPLFGWYISKMKVIPVDRGRGSLALASMTKNTHEQMQEHERQVIIYPEGTRTRPGAAPHYKYGITHLYTNLDVPVQPVALNSGLYWGRKSWFVYPGTIIMEFLDPIEPGMKKDAFSKKLQDVIETASNGLIEEAANSPSCPPLARQIVSRGRA